MMDGPCLFETCSTHSHSLHGASQLDVELAPSIDLIGIARILLFGLALYSYLAIGKVEHSMVA